MTRPNPFTVDIVHELIDLGIDFEFVAPVPSTSARIVVERSSYGCEEKGVTPRESLYGEDDVHRFVNKVRDYRERQMHEAGRPEFETYLRSLFAFDDKQLTRDVHGEYLDQTAAHLWARRREVLSDMEGA